MGPVNEKMREENDGSVLLEKLSNESVVELNKKFEKLEEKGKTKIAEILGVKDKEAVLKILESPTNAKNHTTSLSTEEKKKLTDNLLAFMDRNPVTLEP